jgi:hypothetical protein
VRSGPDCRARKPGRHPPFRDAYAAVHNASILHQVELGSRANPCRKRFFTALKKPAKRALLLDHAFVRHLTAAGEREWQLTRPLGVPREVIIGIAGRPGSACHSAHVARTLLTRNASKPGGPAFLVPGDDNLLIVPALTPDFARRMCRERTVVRYFAIPGADPYTAAVRGAGATAAWIPGRCAGIAPPDDRATSILE